MCAVRCVEGNERGGYPRHTTYVVCYEEEDNQLNSPRDKDNTNHPSYIELTLRIRP